MIQRMWHNEQQKGNRTQRAGFTIVELLIVIVVIGILAAVALVSYTGIKNRSVEASLKADLQSIVKQLELANVDNPSYLSSVAADGGTLKKSQGTTIQYSYTSNTNYCITATTSQSDSLVYNYLSTRGSIEAGACAGHTGSVPSLPPNGGVVTTRASGLSNPNDVAIDSAGNVFVADLYNNRIAKVTPAGVVSAFTTGINYPQSLAFDSSGNLFVAEYGSNRILKVTSAGVASPFAGSGSNGSADGLGTAATFSTVRGLTVDSANNVYVADTYNNKIRKITPAGQVTTYATMSSNPYAVAMAPNGTLYVAEYDTHRISKVTTTGVVSVFAGSGTSGSTDGTGTAAQFNNPNGITVDAAGTIYVADYSNHLIRKITSAGQVTTIAGLALTSGLVNGTGSAARFNIPSGIEVDSSGVLYVSERGNHTVRRIQ